jgi:hypothetical protein
MEFSYRLTGTGWGEARLAEPGNEILLTTSYLTDVLGELLKAIGLLLDGASSVEFSWEQEPGEYRWLFERTSGEIVIRILAFPDAWPRQPTAIGTVIFETRGALRDIASDIVNGVGAVLTQYSEVEYMRRWVEHPFPSEALQMMRERLTQ